MPTPSPTRLRVVSTPLGRFVALGLNESDEQDLDGTEEAAVDAEFVVLDDEMPATRPSAVIDRLRALAAGLRRTPDPHHEALREVIAEARTQQRDAVDAAFAAWEAALPRQEERGDAPVDQSPVPSSRNS